jgi:hypothetical protein
MHPLFRKRSMDAVNEALLKPTEYPAADKEYKNPFYFKGTEPQLDKTGKVADVAIPYDEACTQAVAALRYLAEVSTDEDIIALCRIDAEDLQYFIDQEKKTKGQPREASRGHRRVAEIEVHTGPENGGNPNLIGRSLLDEDVKEEIKDNKGGYKRVGRFSSPLFSTKNETSQPLNRSTK